MQRLRSAGLALRRLIPMVPNEYDTDTGEDKLGSKKLLFTKKIEGIIYLASIERGNNRLYAIYPEMC
jgi:hypothetical protein